MGVLNKKFAILTLGCRVNHYESQVISEELTGLGLNGAPFSDKCDIYIVNSCAVTEESVRKSKQMVRRAAKKNPDAFIAVCGCASQLEHKVFDNMNEVSFVCGTRNKASVIDAVRSYLDGKSTESVHSEPMGELCPTLITSFDRTRAYVKIEDGCEGKCAYCIIPTVRGGIVLRDEEEIITEVKALALGGCHEVVLTGIETSAYGKGLSGLIKRISQINGIKRIRLGSLDPSFLKKDFIDAVAEIPQFCHHFHISLQNGSSRILALMRRRYNSEAVAKNVEYIRSKMPDVCFSADIILGFPTETEQDFAMTVELVRQLKLLHVHAFTYSKRPGTEAAEMKGQIPEAEKTRRLHVLTEIANEIKQEIFTELIKEGDPISVLVETADRGKLKGHTDNFIECNITVRDNAFPELIKGTIVQMLPTKIIDGELYGNLI